MGERELIEQLIQERDEAVKLLADWVARVSEVGSAWDDWDEAYRNAAYRPCGIRSILDLEIEIERAKKKYH
jgi:hypothetical protein